MKKIIILATFLSSVLASNGATACSFDTDCSVGSKCLKKSGALNGVCVGGMNPGNRYDREPVYNSLDLNRGSRRSGSTGDARGRQDSDGTYGDTCSFDTDCGVGSNCVKQSGQLYGTCM